MELEKSVGYVQHVDTLQDKILGGLYGSMAGRMLLKPLVQPWFSKAGGCLLDTGWSRLAIKPFVKANHIELSECVSQSFTSYNDFFTRRLKPTARPVCMEENAFVSPCDARLTVYPVSANGTFRIKHTRYTLSELLRSRILAQRYEGGSLWLYRLCVDDYHRYIYPVTGKKSKNFSIPGVFHTVNPVANDYYPIYKENTREYCLIKTELFGTVLMMEVGALLVGKIENHEKAAGIVKRGTEKGNFAFGGSTIVLLTQKGKVSACSVYERNTMSGIETKVKLGERVGSV